MGPAVAQWRCHESLMALLWRAEGRPGQTARHGHGSHQVLDGPDHAPASRCQPMAAHGRPAGHLGETCSVYQHASAAWRARRQHQRPTRLAASRRRPGPGPVPSLPVPLQGLVANPFIITRPKCPMTPFYLMCLSPPAPIRGSLRSL